MVECHGKGRKSQNSYVVAQSSRVAWMSSELDDKEQGRSGCLVLRVIHDVLRHWIQKQQWTTLNQEFLGHSFGCQSKAWFNSAFIVKVK